MGDVKRTSVVRYFVSLTSTVLVCLALMVPAHAANQKVEIVATVAFPNVTLALNGRVSPKYEGTLVGGITCYYVDANGVEYLSPRYGPQNADGSFGPFSMANEPSYTLTRCNAWVESNRQPSNTETIAVLENFYVA